MGGGVGVSRIRGEVSLLEWARAAREDGPEDVVLVLESRRLRSDLLSGQGATLYQ